MAIIATLRPTENGHAGCGYSIASIPLNKLVLWDGNVRKTGASDNLEELTASIAALGVLQSLVVRKTSRGRFAIIAGRRRYLALSNLAEGGKLAPDAPVPCRVVPGSADATEISLTENVMRMPMHPADQFDAFRELTDNGSTPADIAARFGITEAGVKQRLKLARVSPVIFEAYRNEDLNLEQVQAFAISDDHEAQEKVFSELSTRNGDPRSIRSALTQDEIPATDKRARFVTLSAYEEAGGAVRRDLFAKGDDGIFILDSALLDRLALEKLHCAAEDVRAEGWKWVEIGLETDLEARSQFRRSRPEPLPMSEEAAAEHKRLAEEYHTLFEGMRDDNEEDSERLDAIETRINELEYTESAFTAETFAIAGAIVTLGRNGEVEVVRGLVYPEDVPETDEPDGKSPKVRPAFSASLVESLTEQKSAAISASLSERPDIALASVVHGLALRVFSSREGESSLQITTKLTRLKETGKAAEALEETRERWSERVPGDSRHLWEWCLAQDKDTLLELLAFCAACTIDAVRRKQDRPDCARIAHANALAAALNLDMTAWFTPTAANYFSRVSRTEILSALAQAKNMPAKRSWEKLKKTEFAVFAEREVAGTGWLPPTLKAA
jgi:ParB family transcriptional regulator, chromosome partitioning protein